MSRLFNPGLTPWEIYLLLFSLLLQLIIAAFPDPFPGGAIQTDIDDYRNWTRAMVLQGLEHAYWGDLKPRIDYPPLVPYIYFVLGFLTHSFSPEIFLNNNALNFLLKMPALSCNLLISYIILVECKSRHITLSNTALLALMINVPLIFNTSYWGQTDSIVCLFLLGSLLALHKQRLTASYVFFTLACFTKPLAWPFSLLILLVSLHQHAWQTILRSFAIALLTAFLVLLPFALDGNFIRIIHDVFLNHLDTMPYISVNAHNLWWIVATEATSWTNSGTLFLGVISYKLLATLLFLILYAVILFKSAKIITQPDFDVLKTAAIVAMGFFILSPHMHENHLFNFFPLAFMFMMGKKAGKSYPQEQSYLNIYLLLMVCSTINMAIHDPYLYRVWLLHPSRTLLIDIFYVPIEVSRVIEFLLTSFVTKLGSFITVFIFVHLFWHEVAQRSLPKAWSWSIGLVLGIVALVRVAI